MQCLIGSSDAGIRLVNGCSALSKLGETSSPRCFGTLICSFGTPSVFRRGHPFRSGPLHALYLGMLLMGAFQGYPCAHSKALQFSCARGKRPFKKCFGIFYPLLCSLKFIFTGIVMLGKCLQDLQEVDYDRKGIFRCFTGRI